MASEVTGRVRAGWLLAGVLVLAAGCGGGGGGGSDTAEPPPPPPPPPAGMVVAGESFVGTHGQPFDILANDRLDGRQVSLDGGSGVKVRLRFPWDETSHPVNLLRLSDGRLGVSSGVGVWRIPYEVCEVVEPPQDPRCDSAIAEIEVRPGAVRAVDDTLRLHVDTPAANVLDNDAQTLHDGTRAGLPFSSGIVVEPVGAMPPGVALSRSGHVAVFDGVALATPLVFSYRVCALVDTRNCATARATVEVPASTRVDGFTWESLGLGVSSGSPLHFTDAYCYDSDSGSYPCAYNFTTEVEGTAWNSVTRSFAGLVLPVDRFAGHPGHRIAATSTYFAPFDLPNDLPTLVGNSTTLGSITAGTVFWSAAADAAGTVRSVARGGVGDFDGLNRVAEIDPVDTNNRVDLLTGFPLWLQFADRSAVSSLQDGMVRIDFPLGAGQPAEPPDGVSVLRYDPTLLRWKLHAPAVRSLVGGTRVRYEGPLDGPGLWGLGRVVPAVTLSGCVHDTAGRPRAGADVVALGGGTRANGRTDADGRFAIEVAQDMALTVAVAPRDLWFDRDDVPAGSVVVGPLPAAHDMVTCLVVPAHPVLTLNFSGVRLVRRDPEWGDDEYAAAAVDAPDGTRLAGGGALAQPWIGTYRLYHARTSSSIARWASGLVIEAPQRAPEHAEAWLPLDGEPGFWHAFDVKVASDCSATVRRVGRAVATLPALAPTAATRCVAP